jgi:hypothetical protein
MTLFGTLVDFGVAIPAILLRSDTLLRLNIVLTSLKVKLCTGARHHANRIDPIPFWTSSSRPERQSWE